MWLKIVRSRVTIIAIVALLYVSVLLANLRESDRRSLRIQEEPIAGDYVVATIRIINVNYATAEAQARLSLQPAGRFAKDAVTPAVNLKLLLNSIKGSQEIDFPKGKRIAPIEVAFPLDGNVNTYPFDLHKASLSLLLTTPGRVQSPVSLPHDIKDHKKEHKNKSNNISRTNGLVVSTATLQRSEPLHVPVSLLASIPGIKFNGNVSRDHGSEMTGVVLTLTRSRNVIVLSIIVMGMMAILAMSVLAMALRSTKEGQEMNLLPLTLSASLIFGLPALRNVQPDVPPVGAFGDYISFVWAEVIVAASAVIMLWTWLFRKRANG